MSTATRTSRAVSRRPRSAVASGTLCLGGILWFGGCTPAAPVADKAKGAAASGGSANAPHGVDADDASHVDSAPPHQAGDTTAKVALHEWGLVGSAIADPLSRTWVVTGPVGVPRIGAGDTGPDDKREMRAGKPVIYAHLRGKDPVHLRVSVRAASAEILEHWPVATVVNADGVGSVQWDIDVIPGSSCALAPFPQASDPQCAKTSDGYCELAELSNYTTPDGDCIVAGEQGYDHLFYRSTSTTTKLAVIAERKDDGTIVLRARDGKPAPASVLHVRREGRDVVATEFDLSKGEITLPPTGPVEGGSRVDAPMDWMRARLADGGLTSDESDAFVRAWGIALLSPMPHEDPDDWLLGTKGPPVGLAPSRDALLYRLEGEALSQIVEIETEPAVEAINRAFLAHIDLAPPVTRGL